MSVCDKCLQSIPGTAYRDMPITNSTEPKPKSNVFRRMWKTILTNELFRTTGRFLVGFVLIAIVAWGLMFAGRAVNETYPKIWDDGYQHMRLQDIATGLVCLLMLIPASMVGVGFVILAYFLGGKVLDKVESLRTRSKSVPHD